MKVTRKKGEIPYLERDISWMYFNRRILSEAEKAPVPLLERLSFLGIYSNNLDEFYRVRVATLNRIIEYEDKTIKAERETAIQTFREISRLNALYTQIRGNIYSNKYSTPAKPDLPPERTRITGGASRLHP